MSKRLRQREAQERELQRLYDSSWQDERDRDEEEIPDPEPDEPVNTLQ